MMASACPVKDRECGKATGGYRRAERKNEKGSMWQSSGIRDDDRLISIVLRRRADPLRTDRANAFLADDPQIVLTL